MGELLETEEQMEFSSNEGTLVYLTAKGRVYFDQLELPDPFPLLRKKACPSPQIKLSIHLAWKRFYQTESRFDYLGHWWLELYDA